MALHLNNPPPAPGNRNAVTGTIFSAKAIANTSWAIFDTVVLFRMGTIYEHRFEDFEYCAHGANTEANDREITLWRKEQQKEWDRLSTTMALLGTMNAGIIKIAPDVKGAAPSLWLGAAGLSLCGVFLTQYYSIRAFPMSNSQLKALVSKDSHGKYVINRAAVAMAISSPPLMALHSSALFVAGIVIFVAQTTFDRSMYKVFALLPLGAGVGAVLISLLFGEIMGTMMYREKKQSEIGTRWCPHIKEAHVDTEAPAAVAASYLPEVQRVSPLDRDADDGRISPASVSVIEPESEKARS